MRWRREVAAAQWTPQRILPSKSVHSEMRKLVRVSEDQIAVSQVGLGPGESWSVQIVRLADASSAPRSSERLPTIDWSVCSRNKSEVWHLFEPPRLNNLNSSKLFPIPISGVAKPIVWWRRMTDGDGRWPIPMVGWEYSIAGRDADSNIDRLPKIPTSRSFGMAGNIQVWLGPPMENGSLRSKPSSSMNGPKRRMARGCARVPFRSRAQAVFVRDGTSG